MGDCIPGGSWSSSDCGYFVSDQKNVLAVGYEQEDECRQCCDCSLRHNPRNEGGVLARSPLQDGKEGSHDSTAYEGTYNIWRRPRLQGTTPLHSKREADKRTHAEDNTGDIHDQDEFFSADRYWLDCGRQVEVDEDDQQGEAAYWQIDVESRMWILARDRKTA